MNNKIIDTSSEEYYQGWDVHKNNPTLLYCL